MSQTDPRWPALDLKDLFPEHGTWGDDPGDTVKVLYGATHPVHLPEVTKEDDGVRLDGATAHRNKALDTVSRRLTSAIIGAELARSWLGAIGYHADTLEAIQEALHSLEHVESLIAIHEGQI